jgi:release factor glutamine methyltransferase
LACSLIWSVKYFGLAHGHDRHTVCSMSLPTLMDLVRRSTEYLTKHGLPNARWETEWIFAETLRLTRMELYTRFDMPVEEAEVTRLRELVQRRGRREPLAYVLGTQDFMSLRLHVGPGVLVPRPETEEMVELILRTFAERDELRVVDVGTGSGAIALAIKHARPQWSVSASDVSAEALVIARANGERLGLTVDWHQGNLASHLAGPFDVVVANLPYIGESERDQCDPELAFEPALALFAGNDGLDLIRPLLADLCRLLTPTGQAFLEHGWQQGPAIKSLAVEHGFGCVIVPDGGGKDRIAQVSAHG